jgi:exodeoxyribonuclease V alpha subunit
MQIENDYEKDGDIGTIDDVDSNSGELIASFDGRSVTYGFGELDMPVPAYVTIHNSQGSEYPAVIIPVLTQHYAMLQRTCSIRMSRAAKQKFDAIDQIEVRD